MSELKWTYQDECIIYYDDCTLFNPRRPCPNPQEYPYWWDIRQYTNDSVCLKRPVIGTHEELCYGFEITEESYLGNIGMGIEEFTKRKVWR